MHFYVIAQLQTAYLLTLFDNQRARWTGIGPAVGFASRLRKLPTTLETKMEIVFSEKGRVPAF